MKDNEKVLLIKELKEMEKQVQNMKNKYQLEPSYTRLGLMGIGHDINRLISDLLEWEQDIEIEIEVEC